MKQSINTQDRLSQQLQDLEQLEMPRDIFSDIQNDLQQNLVVKKHRLLSFISITAVLFMAVVFVLQQKNIAEKDKQLNELVKRTLLLEQLIDQETPLYTLAGSVITEKIVNMELWIAQLDADIQKTKNKEKLSKLMVSKLDLLVHMVKLQRKINHSRDYQKIKPLII